MRRTEVFSDGRHDQKAVTQLPAACETMSDGRAADTDAAFSKSFASEYAVRTKPPGGGRYA